MVGFGAWLIWELTEKHPIVDLSLFKNRNFRLGTLGFCLGYAVFFANMLLMPLWLQTQLGYTATWAGLVAAPTGVIAVLVTPLAARMMTRFDARWVATIAFVAFAVSYYLRASLTADASFMAFVLPLMVQGIRRLPFSSPPSPFCWMAYRRTGSRRLRGFPILRASSPAVLRCR